MDRVNAKEASKIHDVANLIISKVILPSIRDEFLLIILIELFTCIEHFKKN